MIIRNLAIAMIVTFTSVASCGTCLLLAMSYLSVASLPFFIVTYYWVQEYPIGICLDVLSLLQMPNVDTIFLPK